MECIDNLLCGDMVETAKFLKAGLTGGTYKVSVESLKALIEQLKGMSNEEFHEIEMMTGYIGRDYLVFSLEERLAIAPEGPNVYAHLTWRSPKTLF